jgi:DUF4097 and DUF4098 domain-containing protein YvlB
MPTYATPAPIDLAVNLPVGAIDIVASDRADTIVTVTPTNPDKAVDRRGAEETSVTFDGARLAITGPKPRLSWIGPTESVDLRVELPSGSRLAAEISVGGVRTRGRLGATRIKNATGGVEVDTTGDLWVRAGHGSVIVTAVEGSAEITADHGQIRIDSVTGDVAVKASHGGVHLGRTGGDVEAKLSYGDLEVATALGGVSAKTAYGSIRLGSVSGGAIDVESGYGAITIGVPTGIAAWLDLSSRDGRVRNELASDQAPAADDPSVAVRARTRFGDITIERALPSAEGN